MPIKVEFIGIRGLEARANFFSRSAGRILDGADQAMVRFLLRSEARSKKDFLTGPRPEKLGVVSGRLRSRITSSIARDGSTIEGVLGTNVKYGRRWEEGFSGTENVKAHTRLIHKAFGKSISPVTVSVGGFSRRVDSKARPFLRPAVLLELPAFEKDIARTLKQGLTPGGASGE